MLFGMMVAARIPIMVNRIKPLVDAKHSLTYWHKFVGVVNEAPNVTAAARKLRKSTTYVSWNSSRLRRAGWNVKKFTPGAKVKGAR